jgi:hypothetical protein
MAIFFPAGTKLYLQSQDPWSRKFEWLKKKNIFKKLILF